MGCWWWYHCKGCSVVWLQLITGIMLSLFSFHLFPLGGWGQLDHGSWEAREPLALSWQGGAKKIRCDKGQGHGSSTTKLLNELPNVLSSRSVVIGRWQKTHFRLFPTNYITHALEQDWGVGKDDTCQRNPKLFLVSKHIYFCSNLAWNDWAELFLASEEWISGKPQQSNPSGFAKCFTVVFSLHVGC